MRILMGRIEIFMVRRGTQSLWPVDTRRCIFAARRGKEARMSEPKMHDAEAKKAIDARLARVEGQVRAVRRMIADDEPCENIAQQLAAARRALDRAFFEMVACMIREELPAAPQARRERAGRVAELLARFG